MLKTKKQMDIEIILHELVYEVIKPKDFGLVENSLCWEAVKKLEKIIE